MAMKYIAVWIISISIILLNESVSAVTVVNTVGSNTIIRAPNILITNGIIKCGKIKCSTDAFSCSVQGKSVNQNANVKTTMICKAKNGTITDHKIATVPNQIPGLSIKSYSQANIDGKVLSCTSCSNAAEAKEQTENAIKLAMKDMIKKLKTLHVRTHDLGQRMTDDTVNHLATQGTLPVSMKQIQPPEIVTQQNGKKHMTPPAQIGSAPSLVRPLASESVPIGTSEKIAPPISSASPDMTAPMGSSISEVPTNKSVPIPSTLISPIESNQLSIPSIQNQTIQLPQNATNQRTLVSSFPMSLSRSIGTISASPIQVNRKNTTTSPQPSAVPQSNDSANVPIISAQNTTNNMPPVVQGNDSVTEGSPVVQPTNSIAPILSANNSAPIVPTAANSTPPVTPANGSPVAVSTNGSMGNVTNNASVPPATHTSLTQGSQSMTSPQSSTKSTVIDSMLASLNISLASMKPKQHGNPAFQGSPTKLQQSVSGSKQAKSSQASLAKPSESSSAKVLQRSLKPSIGSVKTSTSSGKSPSSSESSGSSSSSTRNSQKGKKALKRAVKPSIGSLGSSTSASSSGSSSGSSLSSKSNVKAK